MLSLADAIIQENIAQIKELLRFGVNLNQLDEYGFTPLIEAAIADNIAIARLLIEFGADVNLQDSTGGTALFWASENNNVALARLLLTNGANPNMVNLTGQPILVMPLLRKQQSIKKLLIQAGANLDFAQDFINIKLLGHLFELVGTVDIIDPYQQFIEVDFEGYFLEITLGLITNSLEQFKMHFAGREIRRYGQLTEIIIQVLQRATQLIKYQQYRVDLNKHRPEIIDLIKQEPLIIPVAYEGHAITFVKLGDIFVKCDRREDSRFMDNIVFYRTPHPELIDENFVQQLIYEKQTSEFINYEFQDYLHLEAITELKIAAQISGNCSWANVEAVIPVLFFLLFSHALDFQKNISRYKNLSLDFFHQWREWNKDRALNFCIQSFELSDSIRKACKAEILAAIVFQTCHDESLKNKERLEKILSTLVKSQYLYVLQNYVKTYCYEDQSEEGKYFLNFLKSQGIPLS